MLAAKRTTCGSSIGPHLLRWPSGRPPLPRSWLQEEPFSVPRRQRPTEAVGANVGEPAALPGRRSRGLPPGRQPHIFLFAPVLVIHSVSVPTAPVSVKPFSRRFSTATKKAEYSSLVAASTTHAKNPVPVGLKAPDGGGTVRFCFPGKL